MYIHLKKFLLYYKAQKVPKVFVFFIIFHDFFHTISNRTFTYCRRKTGKTNLKASPYVLNVVKQGYKLPVYKDIPPLYAKNNLSSQHNSEFVTKSITESLDENCIEEVASMPYCCNPLTVLGARINCAWF